MKKYFSAAMIAAFLLPAAAGATETTGKIILRAAIYEWIPGYKEDGRLSTLRNEIEKRFEAKHPDIDLVLAATSHRDKLYKFDTLKKWLRGSHYEEFYHVMEVDTLLLGDLARTGAISPIENVETSNFFEVGLRSAKLDGKLFGIPHLLCGYFLFSRDPALISGSGQQELLLALTGDKDEAIDLVGEFDGSWGLPALYLDAWMDLNAGGDPVRAFSEARTQLDPAALDDLRNIINLCKANGENSCLEGSYWRAGGPETFVRSFSLGHADSLIGYSERLHYIRKAIGDAKIFVRSAPLGDGDNPIMFSDAFVIGRNCVDECKSAAVVFAQFMNSDSMMDYYLLARDLKETKVPRYLLPATRSAFSLEGVREDADYSGLKQHIERATPYPNTGFVSFRKELQKTLKCAIDASMC